MRSFRILALFVLAGIGVAVAGKEFTKPRASDAAAYPAHEGHPAEQVTVAIDPYDSAAKAGIFKVNWRDHGLLPVYFIITNHGDRPISLNNMKIQWVTANRIKLEPATTADLQRRVSHQKSGDQGPGRPLPLPKRGQSGVSKEARNEIEESQFHSYAVEPHSTQSGFLFFDVGDIREPMAGAHLYADGLANADGQELFYFDIPVDKYLAAGKSVSP